MAAADQLPATAPAAGKGEAPAQRETDNMLPRRGTADLVFLPFIGLLS
jgi:hypothetical protein